MRRFQTILEAHATPGAKPNYSIATVFAGTGQLDDAIAPELRSHAARKLKDEQVRLQVQRGLTAPPRGADDDGADSGGGGDHSGGDGKGLGRGAREKAKAKAKAKALGAPAQPAK